MLRSARHVGAGRDRRVEAPVGGPELPELDGALGVAVGIGREVDVEVGPVAHGEVVEPEGGAAVGSFGQGGAAASEVELVGPGKRPCADDGRGAGRGHGCGAGRRVRCRRLRRPWVGRRNERRGGRRRGRCAGADRRRRRFLELGANEERRTEVPGGGRQDDEGNREQHARPAGVAPGGGHPAAPNGHDAENDDDGDRDCADREAPRVERGCGEPLEVSEEGHEWLRVRGRLAGRSHGRVTAR